MTVTIQMLGHGEVQRMLANLGPEAARATRNALNDTARDVQRDFRATLHSKFDVRKKTFIERQVFFGKEDQATKDSPIARIRMKGPGTQQSTLEKFERDKKKTALNGRIAVPARGIRTGGGHVRPDAAWAKLTPLVSLGGSYTRLRKTKDGLKRGSTFSSGTRIVGQRGTWLINLKSGYQGLVRSERGKKNRGLELLWVLKPDTDIPNPLNFVADSRKYAVIHLPTRVTQAIEHALRRMGKGVS